MALVAPFVHAAPTGEALHREAVGVRAPGQAVLLGAAQAGTRIVAVGERGIVALSDDGGQQWRQASVPASVTLTAVRFADAQHGWAIGHGGTVLASEDSGEHWMRQLDGRQAAQAILESAHAGGDGQAVKAAERLVADGADKPLLDLLLLGGQRLLAVGAYGLALASDDGGRSWASWGARLPNPKGLHIYAARLRGSVLLLAGEQGLAMLSTDGGHTFRALDAPYKGSFFTAELLSDTDMVLAGLRGNVLRTQDGGATWASIRAPMPASFIASALDGKGNLLLANQAGLVMTLDRNRLMPMFMTTRGPLNGLLPREGAAPLALTVRGAQSVTTTSGLSN
jgi:photosystem II stability/assembly factor-like uncharacterized protein